MLGQAEGIWADFKERVASQPESVLRGQGWEAVLIHPTAEEVPRHTRSSCMLVDLYLGFDSTVYFVQFESAGCSTRSAGAYCRYAKDRGWLNVVFVMSGEGIFKSTVRGGCQLLYDLVHSAEWPKIADGFTERLLPVVELSQQRV